MPHADFHKALSYGLEAERKAFLTSNTRVGIGQSLPTDQQLTASQNDYDASMSQKMNELVKRRQENAPILQNQINADAARQAQLQQQQQQQHQQVQAQQQQMLMNQMAAARAMGQPVQQGFQHLQHPMQVTQIPQQQQSGLNAGMANAAMLQNRPGQPQRFMMGQQRMPGAGMPANIPIPRDMTQLGEADKQKVSEAAQRLYQDATDQQRNHLRQVVIQKLTPAVAAQYSQQGKDPAMLYFQNQAFQNLQRSMQARLMQRQGMPLPPGQHPGPMNSSMMGGLGPQSGVADPQLFPPANMETIRNEQQIGLMAQQNGQLVVPASMPGRNPTPGPINGLPVQATANNASILGQAQRPQQVQPGFMAGGRINPNALAQARAQAPAQNMMGQPGGLGGPPSSSQSPAMNTLTAPMRQPPVAMNPVANQPSMGQNNQHPGAATLNPSFSHQTNTRPMQGLPMNNQAMAQMISAMPAETRASLSNVAPAKLQELMEKWAAQPRNPLNNNIQGSKPQAQIPNVLGIPGQSQPGPMGNLNQFPVGNNMQQPGVVNQTPNQPTPQQLQARAQIAQLMSNPQARLTMDSLDIPPNVLEHLRSVPQEIRKWGQLKLWLPNSGLPPQMQSRLLQMQIHHFSSLQDKKPGVAAPVGAAAAKQQAQIPGSAPLSNGPMASNMNVLQSPASLPPLPAHIVVPPVTPQELEVIRRTEPRARAMGDDQLLSYARKLREEQYKKKFWQSQAHILQDGGKARGQVQGLPTPQQVPASTPVSAQNTRQPPHQKPAAGPDADASAPGSATLKNARPPQLNRPAASNPSPATAKQSLKRPNSDDSNDALQPPSATQRPSSQAVGRLSQMTPEQVASLSPEQRARYEQALRQRAQQLQAMQNPKEDVVLMKKLGQEESAAVANEEHKPISMSQEEMTELRNKIHWLTRYLTVVQSYIPNWFATTKDEARCRLMFRGVSLKPYTTWFRLLTLSSVAK